MYKVLRSVLFLFDPEWVHYFSMNGLRMLCRVGFIKKLIASSFKPQGENIPVRTGHPGGHYSLFNIQFPNKVGLGAGFDKNAKYLNELETLGFGFVEIGTVTPLPQKGNDKPRLFRLPKDKALINRMGFNNDGVDVVVERLKSWQWAVASQQWAVGSGQKSLWNKQGADCKLQTANCRLVIGGNIGKNKVTPNEDAWKDYEKCFLALHDHVDYFVVNVSSPNTPGLRELQEKDALHKILTNLQIQNSKVKIQKPILLKIAPDLTQEQIDDVIELALEIKLDGLVVSNTTISRENLVTNSTELTRIGAGGLSGLPVKKRSTEIVSYITGKTKGQLPIIASGGIFTGADAKEKIDAGASLVQVWTGFIYEGPGIVKQICKSL
ncbi:MAG: quinone-dependent dihydroorotate dehydrogenase [Ferruginibacter sp.]